ncbi:MAG: hypothetical protein M9964_08065 [Solirubrobacterales bacterium]|nr:hypothetical protein [Solirubrobacterales bacterium]
MPQRLSVTLILVSLALAASAGSAAAVSSSEAVDLLNAQRVSNGIPPMTLSSSLTEGCEAHDQYMELNGGLAHGEKPGMTGYSEAGAGQGAYAFHAEVLAYDDYAPGHNPWESAPIHLLLMLQPSNTSAGFDHATYSCMRFRQDGRDFDSTPQPIFFSYPGPGQSIYRAETAFEIPYVPQELVGIPADATTGPNILAFANGATPGGSAWFESQSASVTGPTGMVDARLVNNDVAHAAGETGYFGNSAVVIPAKPLEADTRYLVHVHWKEHWSGLEYDQEFAFTAIDADSGEGPRRGTVNFQGRPRSGAGTVKLRFLLHDGAPWRLQYVKLHGAPLRCAGGRHRVSLKAGSADVNSDGAFALKARAHGGILRATGAIDARATRVRANVRASHVQVAGERCSLRRTRIVLTD